MKIIKPGRKSFIATCPRCGCQFEYTIEELRSRWPLNYMPCPECENEVYHKNQDEQPCSPTIVMGPEIGMRSTGSSTGDYNYAMPYTTTSTNLPMAEIKLPEDTSKRTIEYINDNSISGRASDFGINGETGTASDAVFWR